MLINYRTQRCTLSSAISDEDRETLLYAITVFRHLFTTRERRTQTFTGDTLKERILLTYEEHTPRIAAIINAIDRESQVATARNLQQEGIES